MTRSSYLARTRPRREAIMYPLVSPSAAARPPRSAREAFPYPLASPSAAARRPRSARESFPYPLASPSAAARQSLLRFQFVEAFVEEGEGGAGEGPHIRLAVTPPRLDGARALDRSRHRDARVAGGVAVAVA